MRGSLREKRSRSRPSWQYQECGGSRNPYPQGGTPALDLRVVFKAKRLTTARALAEEFADPESPSLHYRGRFKKAVAVFEAGLDDALSFLAFPSSHQRLIRSTNLLERLFREVKRTRTRRVRS